MRPGAALPGADGRCWLRGSAGPSSKNSAGAAAAGAGRVLGALLCLHGLGFGLGYAAAKAAGLDEAARRTVSIETGMQNSALAVVLAGAAACRRPRSCGAISATIHSIMGSVLARRWRQTPTIPRRPARLLRVAWSGRRARAGVALLNTWPGRGERASNERRPRPGTLLALHTKYYHK